MNSSLLAGRLDRPLTLVVAAVALAGCAPRSVPVPFPASTAASPEAAEAPSPRVGVALSEDPPLPGEPTAGWVGLEPAPGGGADPHQHHHHHHHGGAPAKDEGPAPAEAPEPAHAH
jgi:hypothetical protein